MKHVLLPAAALLVALPVAAAAVETYTIDSGHTFPAYEINHFGFSLQRGRFNKTAGKVTLDREARKGSVEVSIDTASVSTGHEKVEQHLRSEDFFNAAKHPTITFKGADMRFEGDKVKAVRGELSMNGVSRPVTLDAESFNCAPNPINKKATCGGEFVARIKRSDWGIKAFIPAVADAVLLRINVEAVKD